MRAVCSAAVALLRTGPAAAAVQAPAVPEPATLALVSAGLMGAGLVRLPLRRSFSGRAADRRGARHSSSLTL